jgi:hypothetical protein
LTGHTNARRFDPGKSSLMSHKLLLSLTRSLTNSAVSNWAVLGEVHFQVERRRSSQNVFVENSAMEETFVVEFNRTPSVSGRVAHFHFLLVQEHRN